MIEGWLVALVSLAYLAALFAVASFGDRWVRRQNSNGRRKGGRPLIYALSLSVYCTSWTFFGSVGASSQNGFEFFAVYLGPIVFFLFFHRLLLRVVQLAKTEKITSVADFIAARYGKNQRVAALVTLIAVVGMIPYIALQLKAVSLSVSTLVGMPMNHVADLPVFGDGTLIIALAMAAFAWLFGTRHIDATENQNGMMLAIAAEAVIKLLAFLAVGLWVCFSLFDSPLALWEAARLHPSVAQAHLGAPDYASWAMVGILSFFAILLLPRQFHVSVTENNNPSEISRARWLFPLYLVLINLFVVPIALAGVLQLSGEANPDMFVLALPQDGGQQWLTLFAYLGGLSASTAMVIVTTVALSIMVSNDLVLPLILRGRSEDDLVSSSGEDMSLLLLGVRRVSILAIVLGGYGYYRFAGNSAGLVSIGLLSFAAIAQFAPAFFGGVIWRRATAKGAIYGMSAGFLVWLYTLLLPVVIREGEVWQALLREGPFGIGILRPEALFFEGADPFVHGALWSLIINLLVFIAASFLRAPTPAERLQANSFVPATLSAVPSLRLWRTALKVSDLQATIARYVGEERTQRSFDKFAAQYNSDLEPHQPVDARMLKFAEQLLASAIGSASSRLVISLLLKRRDPGSKEAIKLLDDATEAIQYNRDLLQIALDQVRQGLCVFDNEYRLICWNRQFRELLNLPPEYGQVGTPLTEVLAHCARRGEFGKGLVADVVSAKFNGITQPHSLMQERLHRSGTVLEIRSNPMPDGGLVATFTDITERVMAEDALAKANETLENRVRERTKQLTTVNTQLEEARHVAEVASQDKTRFLAAAGHDILQPLNAARLYSSSLTDRYSAGGASTPEALGLIQKIEASLDSVEEIIGAVLDISRLDTGTFRPEFSVFHLDDVLSPLRNDFAAIAREKGLRFKIMASDITVRSDRRLLRRLLQNLISNALKYTQSGGVLVGLRRAGNGVLRLSVYDSGIGIPEAQQAQIFSEFQRLDDGAKIASGLGLGLSIVERISRVLGLEVHCQSRVERGSCFGVTLHSAGPIPKLPEQSTRPVPTGQLAGLNVLAIDNERQILEGMAALLSGWGCNVLVAADAKEAAKLLMQRKMQPDVVLADYHLDEGTGPDALVSLRWKFGLEFPGILISADRSQDVRDEAQEKGMQVLNKPVKPAALRALLTRLKQEKSVDA
ncbi:PAS domain-containing hybrid sensor histidine kinase/response regulator [Polycladidibacter hongkongensis]|uniref:PAS domain-containing hybrid sensor histidine kinase/response regulator n=1 Tax=Polycladidibacter hongkongensis TaxID=1647556 RepID=UPI00082C9410|nr:PAS domain-containing hybrid sensor histidine kinase/response regulator [Pseudovibrio hongkongensis]